MKKKKFLIITTVPISLNFFKGQIDYLKSEFDIELVSSPGDLLVEISEKEKVKSHAIKMAREVSFFKDIISLIKLIFLFTKIKPDVVHGNTPKGAFLSMIASWLVRVPVRIYYVHGLRYEGFYGKKRNFFIYIERLVCNLATDVYAVSHGVSGKLMLDTAIDKKIKVVHHGSINGVSKSYFNDVDLKKAKQLRLEWGTSENSFVFGFIGRIVKDKGVEELVNSFLSLDQLEKKSFLILVGPYEDQNAISNDIKKVINSHNRIIHCGFQKDIRPYLKNFDVLVLPSYREGFGMSIIEAGIMGVPTIASDITGCNEIITHQINGWLIRPKSVDSLTKAMTFCLVNRSDLNTVSNKVKESIDERYNQKVVWDKSLKSYVDLIYYRNS